MLVDRKGHSFGGGTAKVAKVTHGVFVVAWRAKGRKKKARAIFFYFFLVFQIVPDKIESVILFLFSQGTESGRFAQDSSHPS